MGIHLAEVSVFARMIGKNRHFHDLSQQVLCGVVALGVKSRRMSLVLYSCGLQTKLRKKKNTFCCVLT